MEHALTDCSSVYTPLNRYRSSCDLYFHILLICHSYTPFVNALSNFTLNTAASICLPCSLIYPALLSFTLPSITPICLCVF